MRRFLVILGLTAIVWLGVSMAEPMEYSVRVRVDYVGYDTVRYALASADTAYNVRIGSDGYTAFLIGLLDQEARVQVSVSGQGLQRAVSVDNLYSAVREELPSIRSVSCNTDSLRVTLVERSSKTFRPTVDNVNFEFAEQYGLYGQPVITPSEVTLYGSEADLAKMV